MARSAYALMAPQWYHTDAVHPATYGVPLTGGLDLDSSLVAVVSDAAGNLVCRPS